MEVYLLLSGLLVLVCYHFMHTAGYTLNQKGHEREEQISCETSVLRQKIQIWYKLTSSTESPFYCMSSPLRQKMVDHCAASFFSLVTILLISFAHFSHATSVLSVSLCHTEPVETLLPPHTEAKRKHEILTPQDYSTANEGDET